MDRSGRTTVHCSFICMFARCVCALMCATANWVLFFDGILHCLFDIGLSSSGAAAIACALVASVSNNFTCCPTEDLIRDVEL